VARTGPRSGLVSGGGATILEMYFMQKTTIYLPEDLKGKLARLASTRGISEAQLIRDALSTMVESERVPSLESRCSRLVATRVGGTLEPPLPNPLPRWGRGDCV